MSKALYACLVVAATMLAASPALADPQLGNDQAPAAVAIPSRLLCLPSTQQSLGLSVPRPRLQRRCHLQLSNGSAVR